MSNAYSALGPLYDKFMGDVDYAAWFAHYKALIGPLPATGADLCCGTGRFSRMMAKEGMKITGIDNAPAMLRSAQELARKEGLSIPYALMDARDFALPRPVGLILCAVDGLNYLTRLEDLRRCFARCYAFLQPGGTLAFDISCAQKFISMHDKPYYDIDEDAACLWLSHYQDEARLMTLELTLFKKKGELYARQDEVHVQRAHSIKELDALLNEAGFSEITFYADFTKEPASETQQRLHVIARKA